jgi:hypothetical protein
LTALDVAIRLNVELNQSAFPVGWIERVAVDFSRRLVGIARRGANEPAGNVVVVVYSRPR